ncbi:hypothetical protein G6F62_014335 [Rhizopus arrhizus]|nr:hypothetical protein G6F62_014335 [Rhizopus arrhizus]
MLRVMQGLHQCLPEQRGAAQRQAGHGARLLLELAGDAGVHRVVAAVVRAWRDLIDDQAAILQHEELHAHHAVVAQALRDGFRGVGRAGLPFGVRCVRFHGRGGGHRQDAVAVHIARHGKHHAASALPARKPRHRIRRRRQAPLRAC